MTGRDFFRCCRAHGACLAWLVPALVVITASQAGIVQTNYETGDGTIPSGTFSASGNILATNLVRVTGTGSFYRQDSGYTVDLSRLSDGVLGTLGSAGLGGDGRYTVMPNVATIQFDLDAPFDITVIRTYASWDSGRDGQAYTVSYATASSPLSYSPLATITRFDATSFPTTEMMIFNPQTFELETTMVPDESTASTLVELTSTTSILAEDVVSLRFAFNGVENGGTAFREVQVTAVPEPATWACVVSGSAAVGFMFRRRPSSLVTPLATRG